MTQPELAAIFDLLNNADCLYTGKVLSQCPPVPNIGKSGVKTANITQNGVACNTQTVDAIRSAHSFTQSADATKEAARNGEGSAHGFTQSADATKEAARNGEGSAHPMPLSAHGLPPNGAPNASFGSVHTDGIAHGMPQNAPRAPIHPKYTDGIAPDASFGSVHTDGIAHGMPQNAPRAPIQPKYTDGIAPDASFGPAREALGEIQNRIRSCTLCALCTTRKNTVPGMGASSPLVLVVGEGPGADEDAQGMPFVGKAGQLLDKMLSSIQLSRGANCFIANVIKCRPPNNRDPNPNEIASCIGYLQNQIAVLRPKLILTLGRIATHALLSNEAPMARIHGSFFDYNGIPLMPTYHPSALLRNEELKRPAWEDLKTFRSKLLTIQSDYQTHFTQGQSQ